MGSRMQFGPRFSGPHRHLARPKQGCHPPTRKRLPPWRPGSGDSRVDGRRTAKRGSPSATRANALAALLLAAACSAPLCATAQQGPPSPDVLLAREEVATAYAVAVLKEVSLRNPDQRIPIDELNVGDALLRTATDTSGRTYVFVAFRRLGAGQSGFHVVLEHCQGRVGDYSPRYAGFTAQLADELQDFLAVAGDPSREFPGECKYWIP